MDEDWGFAYRNRIFAAPYITLVDLGGAVEELEWALSRGARVVVMRSAPISDPLGEPLARRPAATTPFWARAAEAGITVAFHSGDAGYLQYADDWGCGGEFESFRYDTLRICLSANPIRDTMAALVCDGVFERHPRLRVATIESGSEWVAGLLKSLKKAYGQMPSAFARTRSSSSCATSGCRPTTRTTSSACATRSAPTTCCSAPTSRTPRASPSRPTSSTT